MKTPFHFVSGVPSEVNALLDRRNVARTRRAELLQMAREFQQPSTAMPARTPRRVAQQIAAAIARLPVTAGQQQVRVEMADTADPNAWTKQWSETVSFESNRTRVVLFDTNAGFSLH